MEANPIARELLENIPVGVFRMTPQGRFVELNPAAAEILGVATPRAAVALSERTFLADPSAWPSFMARIEKGPAPVELCFQHRDGSRVPCTVTARAVRDADGRILSIDGTMVPIREHPRGKADQRRQTSYMRALQDIMQAVADRVAPLEVLKIILKYTLALMHTRHGFFFQYVAQTDTLVLKIGLGIYRPIVGFAIQKGDGLVGKVWQDQTPILINDYPQWPGRHPDAAWDAVYSVAGVPLKSKDSLLGVIGFLHTAEGRQIADHEFELLNRFAELAAIALDKAKVDALLQAELAERRQAEEALVKSEERYRSFFDTNPEGIILVDLEGRILDANQSLLKLTGYPLEELQGKPYHSLVNARYHALIEQNIEDLMRGLVNDAPLEIEYVNKNGASLLISARGWIIADEDSQPVALGAFVRDMTKEKRLAAEKADLENQLQQTQKMEAIGTLTGGIAHDFNNILAGVLGYAELAQLEADETQVDLRRYLASILSACHRARSLVKQILQFSRRDDKALAPLAVTPLLKEAVKLLRSTLPATIRVSAEFAAGRDTVVADATQLHQVVMNLGTNAFQAMRATGGTLTFTLENQRLAETRYAMALSIPPGDYVKITIADNGPGIPDALLERIFEPYFTTKEKQEGTGLGLAVTFGIVKNMNGLIEVEENAPGMTRFAVYLPLVRNGGTEGTEPSARLPRGRNQKILCVDDEAVFLEVVQKHLEGLGYRVAASRSSVEARDRLMAEPDAFDLIITDQTMPELTGVQLAAEIRKHNPAVPIILCTGYSEAVTAHTARQLGITALIMKPVTRKELAKTVHQALQQGPRDPGRGKG